MQKKGKKERQLFKYRQNVFDQLDATILRHISQINR